MMAIKICSGLLLFSAIVATGALETSGLDTKDKLCIDPATICRVDEVVVYADINKSPGYAGWVQVVSLISWVLLHFLMLKE